MSGWRGWGCYYGREGGGGQGGCNNRGLVGSGWRVDERCLDEMSGWMGEDRWRAPVTAVAAPLITRGRGPHAAVIQQPAMAA